MLIYKTVDAVLQAIPHGLEHVHQFILYRQSDAAPVYPDGSPMDAQNRGLWRSASSIAPEIVAGKGHFGLGFVISASYPYFLIDLDGVARPDGTWMPLVDEICGMFHGAAMEISRSGTGVHIIGSAEGLPGDHGCRVKPHLECYSHGRYVALTGTGKRGSATHDCRAIVPQFLTRYGFGKASVASASTVGEYATPCEGWKGPLDDNALIQTAIDATGSPMQMFGERAPFRDLWFANAAVLAQHYPPAEGKPRPDGYPYDRSLAEMALAGYLAFYTGKHAPRMLRIMDMSPLVREPFGEIRKKWANRAEIRNRTVSLACKTKKDVYNDSFRRRATVSIGATPEITMLPRVMTTDEMVRDLVYIGSTKTVIDSTNGRVRSWDAAVGEYAASVYEITNPETQKVTQHSCLLTWRKHPQRRSYDVLTWAPGRPQDCEPPEITDNNGRGFNIWRGLYEHTVPDDWQSRVGVFVEHLEYLVPVEAERTRFIQWLAHILQRPGELPHTAYVMIATTHGIGRNWLSGVLARVIRGHVAASVDLEAIFESEFNAALSQKLLAVVDEAHEGMDGGKRYERGRTLRRLITEESRTINVKYGLKYPEYNCVRWLMFSNYEDALPIDNQDRRFIFIENPKTIQPPAYYEKIYRALYDKTFIASVFKYLSTLDISDFKPGAHAPWNDMKNRSVEAMTSELERVVIDFKRDYPGWWVTNNIITRYVEDHLSDGSKFDPRHMQQVMKRLKIMPSGRYIKVNNRNVRLSILNPDITPAQLENVDATYLNSFVTKWVDWMNTKPEGRLSPPEYPKY